MTQTTVTAPAASDSLLSRQDASDFFTVRQLMVDDQVRPVEVNDPRIITAMRALPREKTVQPGERLVAYADLTVPLNGGRYLLQPMVVARLVQAAEIAEGQRVLVVAAGTGYLASIVAALGAQVTALEENEALLATGRAYTTGAAPSVVWRQGPLSAGDTQGQPFDVIVFDGAIPSIPAFCAAQCAENGRVAGIMRFDDKTSSIFIARKNGESSWNARRYLDVEAPVIPAFEKPSSFSL